MVLYAPNPEEVGKEDVLEVCDKVWGYLSSHLSIALPQTLILGDFLESLSLMQDRAMDLLQNLCPYVAADRTWADKVLFTTNLRVAYLETQGLENFPDWREKLRMVLEQLGWADAAVRDLQVALGDANFTQKKHEGKLTLIFDKLSVFQEGILQKFAQ